MQPWFETAAAEGRPPAFAFEPIETGVESILSFSVKKGVISVELRKLAELARAERLRRTAPTEERRRFWSERARSIGMDIVNNDLQPLEELAELTNRMLAFMDHVEEQRRKSMKRPPCAD